MSAEPWPATCPFREPVYEEQRPRIEQSSLEVLGHQYRYSVLLPSDYRTSGRRYPVLYWLHGTPGNHVSSFTDPRTPHFFEQLTAGQPLIVVFPEGGFIGLYTDWEKPGHQWETAHMRLVEHIDATYRTHARRSQRAVAGLSVGGYGALGYSARHPELFSSAASFSGLLDMWWRTPTYTPWLAAFGPALVMVCGAGDPDSPYGLPVTEQNNAAWDEHNPSALVDKLHGTELYVETGNGVPCDQEDAVHLATETPTRPPRAVEPLQVETNRTFHREALRVGLAHEYVEHCGIHDWRNWEAGLKRWLPRLMRSFRDAGRPTGKQPLAPASNPAVR